MVACTHIDFVPGLGPSKPIPIYREDRDPSTIMTYRSLDLAAFTLAH